jgi:hypothetical protein
MNGRPNPPWIHCGLYRLGPDGLRKPGLVRSEDELVLLIEIDPGGRMRPGASNLTVELWRGDRLRDQRRSHLRPASSGRTVLALRLDWGRGKDGSARLSCRVRLDGREVARLEMLLGQPAIDAQGRFRDDTPNNASTATLLAFVRQLEDRLDQPDGPP